jgi:hypothetical protein
VYIRDSAFKHGVTAADIEHATEHWLLWVDDAIADADPPKLLILGPDTAANILEIIAIRSDDVLIVFHAMAARAVFLRLLDPETRRQR